MADRVVIYGRDVDELRRLKKARSSPSTFVMILEIQAYAGDVERVKAAYVTEPVKEIFDAYERAGIPISLLDSDERQFETDKEVRVETEEDLETQADDETEDAREDDPFVEHSTEALKAKLREVTGRTPSDEMPRERVVSLLVDHGVETLEE